MTYNDLLNKFVRLAQKIVVARQEIKLFRYLMLMCFNLFRERKVHIAIRRWKVVVIVTLVTD